MSHSLGVRRTWFWLLGAGPLVLLLSMLPQYLVIDHWEEYYRHMITHEVEKPADEVAEHTSHEQHCHYGSAACSDQPAPINGRVLPAAIELSEPSFSALSALEQPTSRLENVFLAPAREPPRSPASATHGNHVTV